MVKKIVFILMLLGIALRGYAYDVGEKAPDFKVSTVDGKQISYSTDLKGKKPVYVVFWATWCLICKKELPNVERLYQEMGDKIQFLGINVGINQRIEDVTTYVKKNKLTFPIVYDVDTELTDLFWVRFTPTNLIIGKNGVIRYKKAEMPENHLEFFSSLTLQKVSSNPRSARSQDGRTGIWKKNWPIGVDRSGGNIVVAGEQSTEKALPASGMEDTTGQEKRKLRREPFTEIGGPADRGEPIEGGTEEDLPPERDGTLTEHPRTDP
ncbi:MAG: TlpA disulfide reductase family protein [Desulfatiglandales bacterium]